jgi:hypothetical protein
MVQRVQFHVVVKKEYNNHKGCHKQLNPLHQQDVLKKKKGGEG